MQDSEAQVVLGLGQESPQDRVTRLPGSPGGGGMEIPDYPGRGHGTRRGPGQKPEEHLLKLHTEEESAQNQEGK